MVNPVQGAGMSERDGNSIVRFGIFEADLFSGELRRNGSKVRLQEQPFQILSLLLSRRGEVVTREELRSNLCLASHAPIKSTIMLEVR